MPDRWEKAHGLDWRHENAKADASHDGVTNIREFHLGLDPQRADKICSALESALSQMPKPKPSTDTMVPSTSAPSPSRSRAPATRSSVTVAARVEG